MADRSDSPALNLKGKGDLAELMVAADLRQRGFKIAIPFGEDDRNSDRCYYIPASELGEGRSILHLRLRPALNKQYIGTRPAEKYLTL